MEKVKFDRTKLLLDCVVMGKLIKSEFDEKDINLIYNLISLKEEKQVQEKNIFPQNLGENLEKIQQYTKAQYNYLLRINQKIEEFIKKPIIQNIRQIDFLNHLDNFVLKLNKEISKKEERYSKILLIKHGSFLISAIIICFISIIYKSDLVGMFFAGVVWVWILWGSKIREFNPNINKEDDYTYSYINNSIYIKLRRIFICKEKIKLKLEKELKKILNLESAEYLKNMDAFEFEDLVWRALEHFGYKAKVTKKSWDKGVDIWIEKNGEKNIVQCKRIKEKIGTPIIRDFIGTMAINKINRWYIITTNTFSVDSLLEIEEWKYDIILIDLDWIIDMIQLMNNGDKSKKFDEILLEAKKRIWAEGNRNYKNKRDNQKKYWYKNLRGF